VPEDVLVVPRAHLLPGGELHGFAARDVASYLSAIAAHAFFAPRERVEEDAGLKQIIPYVILRYADRIFLTRRARGGGEARLREKLSIGLGGHITPQDVTDDADLVRAGLEREVAEEVEMPPGWTARPIGVLNNDLDPVGRVHFGLVYIADVRSPAVRVRETNKLDGAFATVDEIRAAYDRLETWSQLVVDAIDLREI
jgi:predicted NUDIX family phosphoesterase